MKKLSVPIILFLFLVACSSMTFSEKEAKRKALDEMAATTIDALTEEDYSLQKALL